MNNSSFDDFPVVVSRETVGKFIQYQEITIKWQAAINLVAPGTVPDFINRHLVDSAQISTYFPPPAPPKPLILFDLGSGGGFPGMVLAMMRPDIKTYLIESDEKKSFFLKTVSRETKTPVMVLTQRIEKLDLAELPAPDIITARALASLPELLRMVLPWAEMNPDLVLLFSKGEKAGEEIAAAEALYTFRLTRHPSLTDPKAAILAISGLCKKAA